jgi:hypothetical protein
MNEREDGGPIHPTAGDWDPYRRKWGREPTLGMSLRDYFAGQALIGAMSKAQGLGDMPLVERTVLLAGVAEILYEAADAMIRERAK